MNWYGNFFLSTKSGHDQTRKRSVLVCLQMLSRLRLTLFQRELLQKFKVIANPKRKKRSGGLEKRLMGKGIPSFLKARKNGSHNSHNMELSKGFALNPLIYSYI